MKVNRKTRRRLKRAVLTLKEGSGRVTEEWVPEDTEPAELYHVCMSQMERASYDVAEVFSMLRVVVAATAKGMTILRSYDIGQGWEFLKAEHRKQCFEEIKANGPRMLIVCPPCGPFSSWQRINSKKGKPAQKELTAARVLLHVGIQPCHLQHQMGNYFVFEHPDGASSWHDENMQMLQGLQGMEDVKCDQCMFGLRDPQNHKLYKKTTRLRTNCKHVSKHMACRCDGQPEHQTLQGKTKVGGKWCNRTHVAQVYPKGMIDLFVKCAKLAARERERVKCLPLNS